MRPGGAVTELQLVKGCCPLDCQDTCAWVATVENGVVTKVAGAREHPVTRGALCAKVRDYEKRTYAEDRLLHPLIRTGPKGSGQFRPATWDEAVSTIALRWRSIIEQWGPEALLPFNYLGSMGVVQRRALMRLFHALGASQFHGSVCGAAGNALAAEGHPRGFDPEDMADARFVLVWGANPVTTSHHTWHFLVEARKRHGARLVVIDPRQTRTARAADEHVALRPGTDWALAAGIGRILLQEATADVDSASAAVGDLETYRRQVEPWTPERVAAECDISPDVVLDLGRRYAAGRPSLIRAGVGLQQSRGGEQVVRALSALALLGGHWHSRGGGLFIETSPQLDEAAAERPDLRSRPARSLDMARLGTSLTDDRLAPPVKALMVWNANPAVSQPDASLVRQGLAREDLFLVVAEHFLTDTALFADVVLPSTTQLEHVDVQGAWGHHYISANNPAVPPAGQSRSHGEMMRLLAAALGLEHPALRESDEQIAASALPADVSLSDLQQRGWVKASPPAFTPQAPLLIAGEPPPSPAPPAGALRVLTPKGHHFLNSTFANMPAQRQAMSRPTLDMCAEDAAGRGLADGDVARVGNAHGTIHAVVRITDEVRAGCVALPGKWWHADGADANLLMPGAWSPGGQPAFNEVFAQVEPASHEDGSAAAARA